MSKHRGIAPRAVVVTRSTEYELVCARHGTHQQAEFFLNARGQSIDPLVARHRLQEDAVAAASRAIPKGWRRARVARHELNRFLFGDDDIVLAVGQDGLVANMAKYLEGQTVIGVNPNPLEYSGALVQHPPHRLPTLLARAQRGELTLERRTMVEARTHDGFVLKALNELFVGHRTHQSARYRLSYAGREERHSSSGVIVATGTGATGWARSIQLGRAASPPLPAAVARSLVFFVREAFPSPATGCSLTEGVIDDEMGFVSEMNEGGVIFGDGIEDDFIEFGWGQTLTVRPSDTTLNLAAG